ncbi:MAG TPA: hypothetical protein VGP26_14625 [Actinophytocola sp.]|nr:hypothetical protein [Actinophytocola sp.]
MAKQALTIRLKATGVRETLAAFRDLPKDANRELREASLGIADLLAQSAKGASHIDAQSAAVGTTVKAIRDRVPVVQAGGSRRITSSRVPAYRLLFGSEFGANGRFGWYSASRYNESTGRQFSPHQGQQGRWFFPTVERELPAALREWNKAADEIVRRFGQGG